MSLYTGGPYKQANGTTISAVSTKVDGGSMKSNSSSNENFRNVTYQYGNNLNPRVVGGVDLGQADWGSFTASSGVGVSGITNGTGQWAGLATMARTSHGLVVGSVINVRNTSTGTSTTGVYNGIHRIKDVPSADVVILNTPYVYAATGVVFATPVGSVASQDRRNFLFRKSAGQVHGVNETRLASAASDYGRAKVHNVKAVRTQQVATAIRAGNFVTISGKFSTQPTQINDFSGWGTDEVTQNNSTNYGLKGEFVYRYGGPSGSMNDYNGKTA
jgi:hypothetical protein